MNRYQLRHLEMSEFLGVLRSAVGFTYRKETKCSECANRCHSEDALSYFDEFIMRDEGPRYPDGLHCDRCHCVIFKAQEPEQDAQDLDEFNALCDYIESQGGIVLAQDVKVEPWPDDFAQTLDDILSETVKDAQDEDEREESRALALRYHRSVIMRFENPDYAGEGELWALSDILATIRLLWGIHEVKPAILTLEDGIIALVDERNHNAIIARQTL